MAVIEVTEENYEKLLNGEQPVVVDHFAEWCGPCKLLSPLFGKISTAYEKKLKFAKLDTEAYPEIAAQNSVFSIPCLIVFYKGKEVDRIIGYMNEDKLRTAIDGILTKVK